MNFLPEVPPGTSRLPLHDGTQRRKRLLDMGQACAAGLLAETRQVSVSLCDLTIVKKKKKRFLSKFLWV